MSTGLVLVLMLVSYVLGWLSFFGAWWVNGRD